MPGTFRTLNKGQVAISGDFKCDVRVASSSMSLVTNFRMTSCLFSKRNVYSASFPKPDYGAERMNECFIGCSSAAELAETAHNNSNSNNIISHVS